MTKEASTAVRSNTHMFDDGYNPAKTKAGVKELQEGNGMFGWASGVGTASGLAVKDYLMERKIPWVGPAAGSLHWIISASEIPLCGLSSLLHRSAGSFAGTL